MFDLRFGGLVARGYTAHRQAVLERARAVRLRERMAQLAPAVASRRPNLTDCNPTVLQTDAMGTIVEPNPSAARWLNVPAARLVGMRLLHFVSRGDTRTFRGIVKGLGYASADSTATVRFRPREGRPELVHTSVERVAPNRFAWTLRCTR